MLWHRGPQRAAAAARRPGLCAGTELRDATSHRIGSPSRRVSWAVGAFVAFVLAGVGSDRIRIPTPKKIALTAAVACSAILLTRVRAGRSRGCGVALMPYLFWAFCGLVSLWFRN